MVAGVVGGCLTNEPGADPSAPQQGSALSRWFSGTTPTGSATLPAEDPTKIDCPVVDVRSGTAAYRIYQQTREGGQELRYQATVGETARECSVAGQTLTIKVGIEGRLLAGPAGAGAPVSVPLRIAVVREGPTPKPLWSKLYRIPVQIAAGQLNTSFVHVEEGITLPLVPQAELDNYVIYVGFDPDAPEDKPQKPRQRARQTASSG